MTPDRYQQIDELFNAALEREPAERAAFLAKACPEEGLRREVESLLAWDSSRRTVTHWPRADTVLRDGERVAAAFTPGMQLGPYKIETLLGAGGMGEVFLALDIRLGRRVAIKTSKAQFSERFGREARGMLGT